MVPTFKDVGLYDAPFLHVGIIVNVHLGFSLIEDEGNRTMTNR